jgi:signal transduction histidine kinase
MHARLSSYKRTSRNSDATRWAAALASITHAVDNGDDADRLPRRIAQAVAVGLGGSPVVRLALTGSNGPRAVLARTAGGRTRCFTLPDQRTPGPTTHLATQVWPRAARFMTGELGRIRDNLPQAAVPRLAHGPGSLALVPLRHEGQPYGVALAYRASRPFSAGERAFLRAAARHAAFALHLRDMLDRANEAVQARELFFLLASHELGNPMSTASLLIGTVEMAIDRNPDGVVDDNTRAAVRMSKQQLEHASALLDRWSEALRRSRGVVEVQRTDVDLVELIKTVVAGMRLRDPRAEALDLHLDLAELRGRWDRTQLAQVVENLLTNALKFGRERPVTVTLSATADGVELRVKDQGIGIERADQERIFQRLVRAVPARQYSGLGLGLWLVKEIVDAHAGRISLDSEPGRGSEFTVWLPRHEGGPRH